MRYIPDAVGRHVARSALLAQKNSPGLLFGVGVVGMVGSTVLACRATLKMDSVLEDAKFTMNKAVVLAEDADRPEYTESDRRRDTSIIQVQTGVKIVRLYAPAIIVGGVSIALLVRSHNILNRRNIALTAAYGALEKGFSQYRSRVVEKYGEEEDRNFRYGTREVVVRDEVTGEEETVIRAGDEAGNSIYARFFDDGSPSWNPYPEYNLIFLQAQQNYANDMLRARGHLFLNEVYERLGIPHSKAGAVVGWVMSKDNNRDNYIDFGVFEGRTLMSRDFVNGHEGAILLDFNVDGVIYDKLGN